MSLQEQLKGKTEQLKGKVKQAVGKATRSDRFLGMDVTEVHASRILIGAVGAVIVIVIMRAFLHGPAKERLVPLKEQVKGEAE